MHSTITVHTSRRYARQLVSGLAALALLLAGASSAAARICADTNVPVVDTKVFPGTMCRQIGFTSNNSGAVGATPVEAPALYYDDNGRALNPSTASLIVICPIVRDASVDTWASVAVVVADRNPYANVTCSARSNQSDGLGSSYGPTNPLALGFYNLNWWVAQTLTFRAQTHMYEYGTYFVRCTIPPRYRNGTANYDSGIYSYRIQEHSECTNPDGELYLAPPEQPCTGTAC